MIKYTGLYNAKPCLVLGTGFHRWVLGESLLPNYKPLVSWSELILKTAQEMGVSVRGAFDNENLALYWEHFLLEAQNKGVSDTYNPLLNNSQLEDVTATYLYETRAKRAAAKILKLREAAYPCYSIRAKYPTDDCWGAVVSLNFDSHWLESEEDNWLQTEESELFYGPNANSYLRTAEHKRMTQLIHISPTDSLSKRVWFPNGHVSDPSSLRMGLRDFGFQPGAINQAFNTVKVFERNHNKAPADKARNYSACAKLLDGESKSLGELGLHAPLPLTWVTEMLYRPVFFAGVGMSDAEVGLWWLMVQRARNLANLDPVVRPKAYILLDENDRRLGFWRTRPCGIEPVICSNWETGWDEMKQLAKKHSELT